MNMNDIVIFPESEENLVRAKKLSEKLNVKCVLEKEEADRAALALRFSEEGLYLTDNKNKLMADFSHMTGRLKKGVLDTELLVRAARIKNSEGPLRAVDATAGFGEDSMLLAAAGFNVSLFEKNPVIAAMLDDALRRAAQIPQLTETVSRMKLVCGDSIAAMKSLTDHADVIYLDPMFPKRKKSALIKKKFQLLQQLESPCENELELFEAALFARPHKIVVKRPAKGAYLADKRPSYSISGKAVRYDVIVL